MLSFHWGQFTFFKIPSCLMIQVTLTMIRLSAAVLVSMEIYYRQAGIYNLKCPLFRTSKYKSPLMIPLSLGSWVILALWNKAGRGRRWLLREEQH